MKVGELQISKSGKIICPLCYGTGLIHKSIVSYRKNKPNRKRRRIRKCVTCDRGKGEIGNWNDLFVNAKLASRIELIHAPDPKMKRFYSEEHLLIIKQRLEE